MKNIYILTLKIKENILFWLILIVFNLLLLVVLYSFFLKNS